MRNIARNYTNTLNLNTATFIGIDAHPTEHTALAINRFEEEKGLLRFDNTKDGIGEFIAWLPTIEAKADQMVFGIEGGAGLQHELLRQLTQRYAHIFEVNPVYTKQRRAFGTRADKSDPFDAKLIAEVVTRKANELPRITKREISSQKLMLKKLVWFYEEVTLQGARIKTQVKQMKAQYALCSHPAERKILGDILKDQTRTFLLSGDSRESLRRA